MLAVFFFFFVFLGEDIKSDFWFFRRFHVFFDFFLVG